MADPPDQLSRRAPQIWKRALSPGYRPRVSSRPSPAPGRGDRRIETPASADEAPSDRDAPRVNPNHRHHLPAGAHVADRRGLTATGAVTVALLLGAAGGLFDVLTGPGLRTAFAVCFVLGCVVAAVKVHHEDLIAAVAMPPLIYCAILLVSGALKKSGAGGSWVTRQALELATSLILGAPVLLTATGLALLVALIRAFAGRRRLSSR